MATDRIEAIEAEGEEKITKLREQVAGVVAAMLTSGEPKRGVAGRLGISVAGVSVAQRSGDSDRAAEPEPSDVDRDD